MGRWARVIGVYLPTCPSVAFLPQFRPFTEEGQQGVVEGGGGIEGEVVGGIFPADAAVQFILLLQMGQIFVPYFAWMGEHFLACFHITKFNWTLKGKLLLGGIEQAEDDHLMLAVTKMLDAG